MASIRTADTEIEISDTTWRLYDFFSLTHQFEVIRGGGVLRYTGKYGEIVGLPGTQLAAQFIRAVVVGFDNDHQTWRLGLHVSELEGQKPTWVQLTHWPAGNTSEIATDAQKAGRFLAEFIGVPLKLFGVKKIPSQIKTGPLGRHRRKDIEANHVRAMARNIKLPLEYPGMWLGTSRNGIVLRIDKRFIADKPGEVAPAYQMCEVDAEHRVVKLLPPTGLLGSFFGASGRQLRFDEIRNVEYRYILVETSRARQSNDDNMLTEVLIRHHSWEVYLTLPEEALLLARTNHVVDSELDRRRISDIAGTKFDTDYEAAVNYYRQHAEDQKHLDDSRQWARAAAMVIAGAMDKPLVETESGPIPNE
jgi:hypothetical protein